MADTGATYPGTAADDSSVGSLTWASPDNIKASGGNTSATVHNANATTHYLKATDFGFSIPAGAEIDGVSVLINRYVSGAASDNEVKLVLADGSIGSTNKAGTGWNNNIMREDSFGGASDLWGETLSPTDVNDADFGAVLSTNINQAGTLSTGTIFVNYIKITVYYTDFDYDKTYSETITLTASELKGVGKVKTDTITFSDALEKLKVIPKIFIETLTLTESKLRDTTKLFADTLTLTENKLRMAGKVFTDTVTMSTTKINGFAKYLMETLTLSDVKTRLNTYLRTFMETLSFTEILRAKLKWTRRSKPSTSWGDRSKPSTSWTDRTKP